MRSSDWSSDVCSSDLLLSSNIQSTTNVSSDEVDSVLKRLEAAKGQDEYHLGEIYLSATQDNVAAVVENARKIMEALQAGGSFAAHARQFSEASTAVVGGGLGWVRAGQLPASLAIGSGSCRERVGQDWWLPVGAVSIKKKKK